MQLQNSRINWQMGKLESYQNLWITIFDSDYRNVVSFHSTCFTDQTSTRTKYTFSIRLPHRFYL